MTPQTPHQQDPLQAGPATPSDDEINRLLTLLGVTPDKLSVHDRAAMQALAGEVLALRQERAELTRKLEDAALLADRDTLCPVFNRRAFERELGREIALATRYGVPLCLVFIDLDRFKQVNDRFGHATGDKVLIQVAEILLKNVRQTDIVGRLGGDEFGIALTHADKGASLVKTQRLANLVDGLTVRSSDPNIAAVELGASCGTVEWHAPMTPAALIAAADETMFRAKSARRASR